MRLLSLSSLQGYGDVKAAVVSLPEVGKHLVFDGQLLHGAVPMESCHAGDKEDPRVTFMVNIWLEYQPMGCQEFPDELLKYLRVQPVPCDFQGTGELTVMEDVADGEKHQLQAAFGRDKKDHMLRLALPMSVLQKGPGGEGTSTIVRFSDGATLGPNKKKDRKSMLANLKALGKAKKQKTS